MSGHDALLLAAADALAAWVHRDDVDKQGRPLTEHCRRVAARLRDESWPAEVQAAGLLHDAGEAGYPVPGYLDRHRATIPLTRTTRGSYAAYITRLAGLPGEQGRIARAIKIADLRDNLNPSRGPIPDSLRKRYERALRQLEAAR